MRLERDADETELFVRGFFSSRKERVDALQKKLNECRRTMTHAFLIDVKEDTVTLLKAVDAIWTQELTKEERERLEKLVGPEGSQFKGKTRCLPDTRTKVLEGIDSWIHDNGKCSRLFWLHGVAGCGKSAVAASACHMLGSKLSGSFFCKRDQDARRNPVRLVWSIAFALSKLNPSFRNALLSELRDPEVFVSMDLASQFERVLAIPLKSTEPTGASAPMVVVIDALDECEDNDDVAHRLSEITRLAPWLLLLVTSRSMPGIAHAFAELGDVETDMDLYSFDAIDDIRALILKELEPGGQLWDVKEIVAGRIDEFANGSQGLFIWIKIVIKFIAENDDTKIEVLQKLLASSFYANAEGALDELYRTVITVASERSARKETVKWILALVLSTSRTSPLSVRAIHALLPPWISIPLTAFENILKRMSAIFIISKDGVIVVHTSVLDFIGNAMRIREEYFLPLGEVENSMALGCFEIMKNGTRNALRQLDCPPSGLRFNMCGFETSHLENSQVLDLDKRVAENVSAELQYSCIYWFDHLAYILGESSPSDGETVSLISDFFESTFSLLWLEALSVIGMMSAAPEILRHVQASRSPVS